MLRQCLGGCCPFCGCMCLRSSLGTSTGWGPSYPGQIESGAGFGIEGFRQISRQLADGQVIAVKV
jgi:hypothetical protein